MKIRLVGSILIVSAAIVLIAAESAPGAALTVHEWGTFTSVAGADGSAIDWDALECSNDLPHFVKAEKYRGFKWTLTGTVRMETPVLYFYSPKETTARVLVKFPHGVITEWFPQAEAAKLAMDRPEPSLQNFEGSIEWRDIKIRAGANDAFPHESYASRYYAARETDASPVTVGEEHEKFLFYRGVGRFQVPLSARVLDDGQVAVENRGAVPSVILFENRGGRIGFRNVGPLKGAVTLVRPALNGSLPQLLSELEEGLVGQGLYRREAHAMVETWKDSWFEEGSRLIYVMPSRAVDEVLPLRVEPAPKQVTRVFVGRVEMLTRETRLAVREALVKNDRGVLHTYGRFLGPILGRISGEGPAAGQSNAEFQWQMQRVRSERFCE